MLFNRQLKFAGNTLQTCWGTFWHEILNNSFGLRVAATSVNSDEERLKCGDQGVRGSLERYDNEFSNRISITLFGPKAKNIVLKIVVQGMHFRKCTLCITDHFWGELPSLLSTNV